MVMEPPHDGRETANFILDFCDEKKLPVTNFALQEIVCFCHVWSLIEFDCALVKHKFEAWDYDPVLPYLYRDIENFVHLISLLF